MNTCMEIPKDWHEFLKSYQFIDSKEVYTNGTELIPVFRVEQLIEHLLKKQESVEPKHYEATRYNGELFACGDCRHELELKPRYCPYCGKPVKWGEGAE